jgi:DNA-binding response OmpR family regulator
MKILVVDDEKEISNFLKTTLEAECFEIDTADNGEQGSFLARTNSYDLIILDYGLPKKDGRTVCREIRKDGVGTPILMLSVQSAAHTKAELLNTGADDYLTKPFSLEELIARIHALVRRPRKIENDSLQVDDLTVDIKKHLVARGSKKIYLTLKEFMLLEYLARNQGLVLTRAMIMENVWDMNADLFSNTIESHISSLRRKIDLPGKTKLIHTISGRGYKIDLAK